MEQFSTSSVEHWDQETGRQKPFAFILFCHPESVKYAVILLNNTALFGQHIKLQHRETGLGLALSDQFRDAH